MFIGGYAISSDLLHWKLKIHFLIDPTYLRRGNNMKKSVIDEISCNMLTIYGHELKVLDIDIINQIIMINDIEQTDRDGRTLIISASFYGRLDLVKYLLDRKVNVNATDKMGFTALHAATQNGYIDIITFLLDNGAEVNARDMFDNTLFRVHFNAPAICKLWFVG